MNGTSASVNELVASLEMTCGDVAMPKSLRTSARCNVFVVLCVVIAAMTSSGMAIVNRGVICAAGFIVVADVFVTPSMRTLIPASVVLANVNVSVTMSKVFSI